MQQAVLCDPLKGSQRCFLWEPVCWDNLKIFTRKSCSVKNSRPIVLWINFPLAIFETQNHGNQRISQEQGVSHRESRAGKWGDWLKHHFCISLGRHLLALEQGKGTCMRKGGVQELSRGWVEQLQQHSSTCTPNLPLPTYHTQSQAGLHQNKAIHLKSSTCTWKVAAGSFTAYRW